MHTGIDPYTVSPRFRVPSKGKEVGGWSQDQGELGYLTGSAFPKHLYTYIIIALSFPSRKLMSGWVGELFGYCVYFACMTT